MEDTRWRMKLRGFPFFNAQLYGGWFTTVAASATCMAKPRLPDVALQTLVTRTISSRSQQVSLNLLVIMVPSEHDESAQIVSIFFCAKVSNFAGESEPNRTSFWGNDLEYCQKSRFSSTVKNACLSLSRFAYRANRELESGSETTPGLILMPQIQ